MSIMNKQYEKDYFDSIPWFLVSNTRDNPLMIKCPHCLVFHNDLNIEITYKGGFIYLDCGYVNKTSLIKVDDTLQFISDYFKAVNLNIDLSNSSDPIKEFYDVFNFIKTLE